MTLSPSVLKMRDLLLRAHVVNELQMRAALGHVEQFGGRLPSTVTEMGFADAATVVKAIATELRLPLQPMGDLQRDRDALARLDVGLCHMNAVFPISLNPKTHTLVLAMADPTELDVIDLVAAKVGARVQPVVADEAEILAAVARHYLGERFHEVRNRAREAVASPLEDLELDRSPPPPVQVDPPSILDQPPGANTLLDEMLGDGGADALELSEEELVRLGAVKRTQEQTATILQALRELLAEKGL